MGDDGAGDRPPDRGDALPRHRDLVHGVEPAHYIKKLWTFARVVNENRQYEDHQRPVTYELKPPKPAVAKPDPADLFVHLPEGLRRKTATPAAG